MSWPLGGNYVLEFKSTTMDGQIGSFRREPISPLTKILEDY